MIPNATQSSLAAIIKYISLVMEQASILYFVFYGLEVAYQIFKT